MEILSCNMNSIDINGLVTVWSIIIHSMQGNKQNQQQFYILDYFKIRMEQQSMKIPLLEAALLLLLCSKQMKQPLTHTKSNLSLSYMQLPRVDCKMTHHWVLACIQTNLQTIQSCIHTTIDTKPYVSLRITQARKQESNHLI